MNLSKIKSFLTRKRIMWIVGVLVFLWLVFRIYGYVSCGMNWHGTNYTTKYSPLSGCLVLQSNGKWLPEDKVRPE